MTTEPEDLAFRSHVGRDVLQNAAMFSSASKAVLEYVLNSLQYVDAEVAPIIFVNVDEGGRKIEIADNGRGMDRADLENFFTMHAPNVDRQKGRAGRGLYGTGKSAGLGIGKTLQIDTVRNGLRNVVSVSREDLERSEGDSIPLNHQKVDEAAPSTPNGTVVRIESVGKDRLNPNPIVEIIERNLTFWRHAKPTVEVNGHLCEIRVPNVSFTRDFKPEGTLAEELGSSLALSISASQAPLPDSQRGVFVLAGEGHLVAVESVGVEAKRFGTQLFGQVECAALLNPAGDDDPVEAVDSSRSLSLNIEHPVAHALKTFIAQGLETVRLELEEAYESARALQSRKELEKEASKIADLLNDDLKDVIDRIDQLKEIKENTGARSTGGPGSAKGDDAHREGGDTKGILDPLDDIPDEPGAGKGGPGGEGDSARSGQPDPSGSEGLEKTERRPQKRRRRGGLQVDFRESGEESYRAYFDETQSTIVVNLDHPQLQAARGSGGGTDDAGFRRTAYETAFTEYAQVIARAVSQEEGFLDPNDLLFEIADALDRVSRAAVPVYRSLV